MNGQELSGAVEDDIKDQGGNTEYFALYKESELSEEAEKAVQEHIEKYKNGEYKNEESSIYVSIGEPGKGRDIVINGDTKIPSKIEKVTGTKILFDKQGVPQFFTFSKEIDRINNYRIQAEDAGIDFLTGLHNRAGWEKYLDSLAHDIQRNILNEENYITIFYADLNNLKEINDTKGHTAGDEYIIRMAKFLKRVFSRDKDEHARWGGDEYGVCSISNQQFEGVLMQRLGQLKEEGLQYCAGIKGFKIKDFLKEIGFTEDMSPEEKLKRIKEGLAKKFEEVEQQEKEAKEKSKEMAEGKERPTIII